MQRPHSPNVHPHLRRSARYRGGVKKPSGQVIYSRIVGARRGGGRYRDGPVSGSRDRESPAKECGKGVEMDLGR